MTKVFSICYTSVNYLKYQRYNSDDLTFLFYMILLHPEYFMWIMMEFIFLLHSEASFFRWMLVLENDQVANAFGPTFYKSITDSDRNQFPSGIWTSYVYVFFSFKLLSITFFSRKVTNKFLKQLRNKIFVQAKEIFKCTNFCKRKINDRDRINHRDKVCVLYFL